jgi:hypothetical protein
MKSAARMKTSTGRTRRRLGRGAERPPKCHQKLGLRVSMMDSWMKQVRAR